MQRPLALRICYAREPSDPSPRESARSAASPSTNVPPDEKNCRECPLAPTSTLAPTVALAVLPFGSAVLHTPPPLPPRFPQPATPSGRSSGSASSVTCPSSQTQTESCTLAAAAPDSPVNHRHSASLPCAVRNRPPGVDRHQLVPAPQPRMAPRPRAGPVPLRSLPTRSDTPAPLPAYPRVPNTPVVPRPSTGPDPPCGTNALPLQTGSQ